MSKNYEDSDEHDPVKLLVNKELMALQRKIAESPKLQVEYAPLRHIAKNWYLFGTKRIKFDIKNGQLSISEGAG